MNTNFFNQLAQLDFTGVLQLNIAKTSESGLIVSVMLNNEQCGDKAKNLIPPLNLRGTATELDQGFISSISTPLQAASGLMTNMEAYMKQVEEAKKQSAMEKDKADKEKKAKGDTEKKYTEAMQKVAELEKAGKHKEALSKLPKSELFPEHADEIKKRKTALSAKVGPDMFSMFSSEEPEPEEETEEETEEPENEEEYEEEENED